MDTATQEFVSNTAACTVVLGDGNQFRLVPLHGAIRDAMADAIADARVCGFLYCGLLGVQDREIVARYEPHAGAMETVCAAIPAFSWSPFALKYLQPHPKDDFTAFAERLWSLEDPRN